MTYLLRKIFFLSLHNDKWVSNNSHKKPFFLSEVRHPFEVSLFDGTVLGGNIWQELEPGPKINNSAPQH